MRSGASDVATLMKRMGIEGRSGLSEISCEGHNDGKEGTSYGERKQPAISDGLLDQLLAGADPKTAFAKDGLLDELKKALLNEP